MFHDEQKFFTSMDDFNEHFEEHTAIWKVYSATYWEPEDRWLISVDGMGEDICPEDLWKAALNER